MTGTEEAAINRVVLDYLEGMIWGDDDMVRSAMHPLCMQAGHLGGRYEFISRDEFIEELKHEKRQPPGSAFPCHVEFTNITGDMAVVKVRDTCFGSEWTDYLTLIKHEGRWQIVMKAFFQHSQ